MTATYEVIVTGRASPMLRAATAGFEVDEPEPGKVRVVAQVRDQAALHALLERLADLRLDLLGVRRVSGDE